MFILKSQKPSGALSMRSGWCSENPPFPPLGALTVAAMLPDSWQKRLIDMNVKRLRDEDLKWADYVFISAMIAQSESTRR